MTMLLAIRIVVLLTVVSGIPDFPSAAADRYRVIAHSPGAAYRDFEVEYAPGELIVAQLVGRSDEDVARGVLALLAFSADVATFLVIRRGWGRDAAQRYLWLGSPLLIFIYRRADLVTVALAAGAILLARRGRQGTSGLALATAVLTRLWPAVLVPILVIDRRARAIWVFTVAASAGLIAWVAFGGLGAVRQVSSFRGATGWELESSVGVVVWALTDQHRFESGANRTGTVPGWAGLLMLLLLLALTTCIWLRARRLDSDPAGLAALAAVAGLLVLSPLLSPQYVSWLLPWAAIAGATGRRWSVIGAVPIVLTGAIVTGWYLDLGLGAGPDQTILFLRNCSLVAIVIAYFVRAQGERAAAGVNGVGSSRVPVT
ncbi:MAG: glycosyltransferase 87 family protein [Actinomycetota bacterium]